MRLSRKLATLLAISLVCATAGAQKWQTLKNKATFGTDTALLLTDGTVIVHEECHSNWHRLTPDKTGSYLNGTWSTIASMPSTYSPLDFTSAVLADGRVLVEGGEYNNCQSADTNLGAIYDPVKDQWTSVDPPSGWSKIGDTPAVVLADGTFMLGQIFGKQTAIFDAKTLTWTVTGSDKADEYTEEGMELLPSGQVLLVDTQNTNNSEIFDPGTHVWSSAGNTIANLSFMAFWEIGPAILRPDGTVFAAGASYSGPGHTAIYDSTHGTWSAGPDFPNGNDMADAPAAPLPDGNVLVETSPGVFNRGVQFYEFDGTQFITVPNPSDVGTNGSSVGRLLVLPTGQILYTLQSGEDAEIYTPSGAYNQAWAPTISSVPRKLARGKTYKISGTQFNGLSQGAAYGDDAQMATNYPLVRITNKRTKHVFYARTHDHSTMGVATGSALVSTRFDVPKTAESGASTVVVVANGIPSVPVNVTVQ